MAEVEFGDVKLTGGKMLLIIPLLGSILGAMWGGFEVYQRLLDAEEAVTNYVAPDMSGINQQLAVQAEMVAALKEDVEQQFDTVTTLLDSMQEDLDRVREDADEIDTFVRTIDESTNETQRDLRNDVYGMETELNDRLRELDAELREMRDDLEEKIERILDNPLNDSE
jgi:chromosome segregation ATPase